MTPLDNDIHSTIVGERRPTVALDVEPATTEMELGASQVVDVTVSAVGGEAGSLEGLDFDAPTILSATEGSPLAVVGVAGGCPRGLALDRGGVLRSMSPSRRSARARAPSPRRWPAPTTSAARPARWPASMPSGSSWATTRPAPRPRGPRS
ncbi:MAG: hypothetical protein R3C32_07760 [Chloroflexota bacterium]